MGSPPRRVLPHTPFLRCISARGVQCLLLLLAFASASPRAAQVDGLYEGLVPVASEREGERDEALGRALRQVVSKVTGIAEVGGAAVSAAAAEPRRLLQRFQYRETGDPAAPLDLWARFEPSGIDALVRDAGLPLWSAQRPGVLAWVAVARGQGPEIVAPDAGAVDEGLVDALSARAWKRGVPLSFPLLDLEDRVRIRGDDLWSLDEALIRAASTRYAPGAILVGRLEAGSTGAWTAQWWLAEGEQTSRWETRGLSAADAAAGALDTVADRFAARYALASEQAAPGGTVVRVSGVRTLTDYARTLGYLQSLDQVSGLMLSTARGDEFTFRMQVRGGAGSLRRIASFGGVLAAEPAADDDAVRFRLLP